MGLLDSLLQDDGARVGLGLLAAAGPSAVPQSFGQRLMGGLLNAQQIGQQQEDRRSAQEMRALQMQQHQLMLAQAQREAQRQQQLQALAPQFARTATQNALTAGGGPTKAAASAMETAQPSYDFAGYAQALAPIDPMASLQLQASLKKERPKIKEFKEVRGSDGSVQIVGLDEYGTPVQTGQTPFKDGQVEDFGGAKYVRDPITNKLTLLGNKTATPDARLTAGVTMRGQDLTDARARDLNAITREGQQTQVINDPERGILFANKGTGLVRPGLGMDGKPLAGETSVKRENAAKRVLPILDEADKLIDQSTGSYIGTGVDLLGRAVGATTGGAEATAKLKVLEGNLMLSQPRMEGPQSDKDTMLYRQMAGQIGDPTVPRAIKKAALQTIRQIQEKYAGGPQAAPQATIPGLKFLGFEGQ